MPSMILELTMFTRMVVFEATLMMVLTESLESRVMTTLIIVTTGGQVIIPAMVML